MVVCSCFRRKNVTKRICRLLVLVEVALNQQRRRNGFIIHSNSSRGSYGPVLISADKSSILLAILGKAVRDFLLSFDHKGEVDHLL